MVGRRGFVGWGGGKWEGGVSCWIGGGGVVVGAG
jgi:hypothetical protein